MPCFRCSHAPRHILTHCVTDFHVVGGFVFMQVVHTDTACTKIALQLCADVLYFHTVCTVLRRASCRQELSHNAGDRFPLTMGACHAAELRSHEPRYIFTNRATFSRTVPCSHAPCHALTKCVIDFHIVHGLAFMQVVHTDTVCTKITQRLCADVLYFHTARTFLRRASRRHELYPIMPVTVSP